MKTWKQFWISLKSNIFSGFVHELTKTHMPSLNFWQIFPFSLKTHFCGEKELLLEIPVLLEKLMLGLWGPCNVGDSQFVPPCGHLMGPSYTFKTWPSNISIALNTKSFPVWISLSVLPAFNSSGKIFHLSPMVTGVFSICPFPERDWKEWKINGAFCLFMCVLQNGFWRGKLSSI